jgi:hypothetical protein
MTTINFEEGGGFLDALKWRRRKEGSTAERF